MRLRRLACLALAALSSLVFCPWAGAQPAGSGSGSASPPSYVWRVDTRPPDYIFANGFAAWGDNDDPVAHLQGRSCQTRFTAATADSAFISTTADENVANILAEAMLRDGRNVIYVYRVQTDDRFYSLNATLFNLAHLPVVAERGGATDAMARQASIQGEWVALRQIPGSLVESVLERRIVDGHVMSISARLNYDRQIPGSSANSGPYVPRSRQAPTLVRYVLRQWEECSACMSPDVNNTAIVPFIVGPGSDQSY